MTIAIRCTYKEFVLAEDIHGWKKYFFEEIGKAKFISITIAKILSIIL